MGAGALNPAAAGAGGTAAIEIARAARVDARLSAGSFAARLSEARRAGTSPERAAREAAEDFVSLTLVEPVLASLRESDGAAPPFAPGDAERSFRPLFDAEIARRIVKKSDFGLVNEVARRLLDSARGATASSGAAPAPELDRHA